MAGTDKSWTESTLSTLLVNSPLPHEVVLHRFHIIAFSNHDLIAFDDHSIADCYDEIVSGESAESGSSSRSKWKLFERKKSGI